HNSRVFWASISADGRRVATGITGEARIWDAGSGRPLTAPMVLTRAQNARESSTLVAFSPDDRRLLTWAGSEARVWESATGQPLTPPLRTAGMVSSAGFSPDGQRVVVGDRSGTARIWDLSPAPQPLSEILLLTQAQTSRRIDPR